MSEWLCEADIPTNQTICLKTTHKRERWTLFSFGHCVWGTLFKDDFLPCQCTWTDIVYPSKVYDREQEASGINHLRLTRPWIFTAEGSAIPSLLIKEDSLVFLKGICLSLDLYWISVADILSHLSTQWHLGVLWKGVKFSEGWTFLSNFPLLFWVLVLKHFLAENRSVHFS